MNKSYLLLLGVQVCLLLLESHPLLGHLELLQDNKNIILLPTAAKYQKTSYFSD